MIAAICRRLPPARYLALTLAVAGLVFLGWRWSHGAAGSGPTASSEPVAPGFRLDALDGGGSVDLARYSGKTVVVNFWASWCGPCEDEASTLESAWRRWSAKGIEFIGVDSRDSTGAAKAFVEDQGVTYPIAVDASGGTAADYGVSAMPQTFVISSHDRVLSRIIGPVTEARIDGALEAAGADQSSAGSHGA